LLAVRIAAVGKRGSVAVGIDIKHGQAIHHATVADGALGVIR
jgi:hypothetical protein